MPATGMRLMAGLLVAGLAACATLRGGDDPPVIQPRDRLAEAALMLERGDFRGAYPLLNWVYARCTASRPGRDALLLLAAAELDPRNDARRLNVGAALAAEYLSLAAPPPEGRPLAETLYLLGRELGGEEPESRPAPAPDTLVLLPEECRPSEIPPDADAAAPAMGPAANGTWLPELPGRSVPQRLAALAAERDAQAAQAAALAEQVRQLQQRVAGQQQEIERIRKTLRP